MKKVGWEADRQSAIEMKRRREDNRNENIRVKKAEGKIEGRLKKYTEEKVAGQQRGREGEERWKGSRE